MEHLAQSMAAQIIIDDEKRRAQELVSQLSKAGFLSLMREKDVFNIAPKRPNWDLKRELDKKLAKLERRTQESIHILIRE